MKLTSTAFIDNGEIPEKYTCDGENTSPPMQIDEVPLGAKSLCLIVTDPDAPRGEFVHWLAWNINPLRKSINEGEELPEAVQGKDSAGNTGWTGPCPPDSEHRYIFHLYALDALLEINFHSKKEDLLSAMQGKILDEAILTGLYSRGVQQW